MGKRLQPPQWFKDAAARERARRAKGDVSASEMYELLADGIQTRHQAGDMFGRSLWIKFIASYDESLTNARAAAAAEEAAFAEATGYLQDELYPQELLERLGLPLVLDLGGYGKTIVAIDARHSDLQAYLAELERKKKSWDTSLQDRIAAATKALELLPADNSKTLRQVIADPDEHRDAGAQ